MPEEARIGVVVRSRWLWTSWVLVSAAMHATWGMFLIAYSGAAMATPVASMASLFPGHVSEGVVLLVASVAACIGLRIDRGGPSMGGLLACIPQQALLMMSAFGSSVAAYSGTYADGTPATSAHIIVDQLPMLLIAAGHTFGLILFHGQALSGRARAEP